MARRGLRIKLTKPQTDALRLVRDGQGEKASSVVLRSLYAKGLVERTTPLRLTEQGVQALQLVDAQVALAGSIIKASRWTESVRSKITHEEPDTNEPIGDGLAEAPPVDNDDIQAELRSGRRGEDL